MKLSEKNVRSMLRLLGETAAISGGHAEKKQFLMDGICKLINANSWVWLLGCQPKPRQPHTMTSILHSGFTQETFANYLALLESKEMVTNGTGEAFYSALLSPKTNLSTFSREDIDPESVLTKDKVTRSLMEKADIDSFILSAYPLQENSYSGIAVYRHFGAPPFSAIEVHMVHLILSEVTWLHMSGWPEDVSASIPSLSPRERTVLNLMLDGLDRKQISSELGITQNTVSGYTKSVFRHFNVNSHVALLRKFLYAER